MKGKRISQTNVFAKECIVLALLKLIYIKPLSSITISELCEKAGVSRMTFYRNYESKEDIFKKRLCEIFEEYKKDSARNEEGGIFYDIPHLIHYFNYLYKYRDFMDGLLYCGYGIFFFNMLGAYMNEKWSHRANRFVLASFAGSLYSMFTLWGTGQYCDDAETLAHELMVIYSGCETGISDTPETDKRPVP